MSAVASLASLASKSNTDTDAAIASVILFSDAYARVSGNADIDVTGAFVLSATNAVISTAIADGTAHGRQATLGVSAATTDTEASVSGQRNRRCRVGGSARFDRKHRHLGRQIDCDGATDDGNGGTQTKSQTALSTNNA
ncbi:hypothetical protein LP420_40165 [Massilia sp. B-10]|nr:hypothetical protein LP420_40165 [Massilia sp. B-10]